jgi:Mrp family chromosome partitioning ATPase
VIVVKAGSTNSDEVYSTVETLNTVKANILGFILNAVSDVKR